MKFENALASLVSLDILHTVDDTGDDFSQNGVLSWAIRKCVALTQLNKLRLDGSQPRLTDALHLSGQILNPGELVGVEWSFVMAQIEKSAWGALDLSNSGLVASTMGAFMAFPLPTSIKSLNLRQLQSDFVLLIFPNTRYR